MDGDFGEGEFVAVSVPTDLVRRLIDAITDVMQEWEEEAKDRGEIFTALVGNSAMHIATEFIDASIENLHGETLQ
jgi:hypothetical protein